MKKVLLIVFAFVTILAFSFTPVKAENPNLFNPSPGDYAVEHFDGTLYRIRLMYSLDLLENHQYQLSLSLDNAQSYQDIYDDLYNISINLSWNFFFNFGTDAFSNFNSNVSIPFETSPGMTQLHFYIETYWNSLNDATYYMNTFFKDVFNSNNIQVVLTGQVAPIDEVEPEFTYSNLQFNAFYYDLPTVQGIQSQLTAIDDQDGDVSDRIVIENDQYTGQTIFVGGEYYILFSVDDLAGNKAYLRVNVNIVDDLAPVATYDGQTLNDYDTIFFSWYDDDDYPKKLTESEIADLIYFFDEIDQLALDIQILVNYTGEESFYNVPGIHMLEVSATDYSGNIIRILVQVEVLANARPVITGPSSTTIEITTFNLNIYLLQFSATDLEDGVLPLKIESYRTTFQHGAPVLGSFVLYLIATDSLGKVGEHSVVINVVDTTIPVFKINNIAVTNYSIMVPMSNTSVLQALIDSIVVTDAYYGTMTSSKVVPALPGFLVPATSNLVITATDPSGNTGTLTLTVTIQDDILPVINGATKIVKGKTGSLVLSEITAQLSAVDNVSGVLNVEVVADGYTGNGQKIGSYLVRYKATDGAGNIRYHDVRVWVVDNVAPVWIMNDYFINLGINQSMSRMELLALLQASGMIPGNLAYTVVFMNDEYTGNEATPGTYSVTMRITFENGSESNLNMQLNVPEDPNVIIVTPDTPTTGFARFFDGILSFLSGAWNFTKDVVVTVWDGITWTWENIVIPVYEWVFVKDTNPVIPPLTTQTPTVTTTTRITTTTLPQTPTTSYTNVQQL